MKRVESYGIWLLLIMAFLLTGCYTQFEVIERTVFIPADPSAVSEGMSERAEQRSSMAEAEGAGQMIENEEDYALGYEDGWEDAESYYFKDYESAQWYKEKGVTLSGEAIVHNHYYFDSYY
jgi:translation initiation factor 2 beta subunit (eIF-2beta)/eIF-5